MIKAIFYGGAFNPVTKAHIFLADYVRQQLGYEKVIFMPTKGKYIKYVEGKELSFSEEERLELLKKIAGDKDWMIVSDYEITKVEQPRTYFTMKALRDEGYDLKLLFGSDWLPNLSTKWRYIDEICKEFGIIVMTRGNDDIKAMINNDPYLKQYEEYFTLVETPDTYRDVSSTKVRLALRSNDLKKACEYLPEELHQYFIEGGKYDK